MDTEQYLSQKQRLWALQRQIPLRPKYDFMQTEPHFTVNLEDNFFQPPEPETLDELVGPHEPQNGDSYLDLHDLYSSTVMALNFFYYWKSKRNLEPIMDAFGLPGLKPMDIAYERKCSSSESGKKQYLFDINIQTRSTMQAAVVCSFAEPFHNWDELHGLSPSFIEEYPYWSAFPRTEQLAREISPFDTRFGKMNGPRLIKRALDLYLQCPDKDAIILIYLHQPAFFLGSSKLEQEINWLQESLNGDGVTFKTMGLQQLIMNLKDKVTQEDSDYLTYLTERYF